MSTSTSMSTSTTTTTSSRVVTGLDHVAIVTADLDRFIDFYRSVLGLDVVLDESLAQFRHAMLRVGPESILHAFEAPENRHAIGRPDGFDRGHLDHFAVRAADAEAFAEIGERLHARGASDGPIIDFGIAHSHYFRDPDGMSGEVTLILDADFSMAHPPRQLADAVAA